MLKCFSQTGSAPQVGPVRFRLNQNSQPLCQLESPPTSTQGLDMLPKKSGADKEAKRGLLVVSPITTSSDDAKECNVLTSPSISPSS